MLYNLNEKGEVINNASIDCIQPPYQSILKKIEKFYKKTLGENLLSIYIRGSVSVGRAKPFISDVDSVAITHTDVTPQKLKVINEYSKELQQKHPFVTLVDMTVISRKALWENDEFSNLKIYLKTQSVCLYGENVTKEIEVVRPGRELALEMYGDLPEKLQDLEKVFSHNTTEKTYLGEKRPIEFWCIWTMRTILRSGLGLVMFKRPVYSQDLETCAEVFLDQYPEYKLDIEKALFWAMNPTSDKERIHSYLKEFLPMYISLWNKARNN